MSLRPIDPKLGRVRRAGQRMAPGGRRWSESPIPRVGKRRLPSVGVLGEAPVFAGYNATTTGDGSTLTLPSANFGLPEYDPVAGDVIVAFIGGIDLSSLTLPAGWVAAASGTVGSHLTYRVAYLVVTGSDAFGMSWSPTWNFSDPAGYANNLCYVVEGDGRTPVVSVSSVTGSTSSGALPTGGMSNAWMCVKSTPDSNAPNITAYPDAQVNADLVYAGYSHDDSTKSPLAATGSVTATANCDWALFSLTWS